MRSALQIESQVALPKRPPMLMQVLNRFKDMMRAVTQVCYSKQLFVTVDSYGAIFSLLQKLVSIECHSF